MRKLGILLGAMLCTFAGAQECGKGLKEGWPKWAQGGVYQGTLGSLPIVMSLPKDNPYDSRYAYLHKGLPIELDALTDGKTLYLREWVRKSIAAPVMTGCFALNQAGTGLTGRWQAPQGNGAQAVKLTRVNAAALPLKLNASPELLRLRREDAFTFVRLNHPLTVKEGQLYDPLSGVSYPLPKGTSGALRAALQDRLLINAAGKLDCQGMAPENKEEGSFWYNLKVTYPFQSARLLSGVERGDAFCGGAHPSLIFETFTLDRSTGQQFKLTDLWPELTPARLTKLYVQGFKPAVKECRDEMQTGDPLDIQWLLTSKGLQVFSNSYSEAARICRTEAVTVPYSTLQPAARRESPYYREIYR